MTYRALELLNLDPDEPAFLLDIGCGSGLSGEILDEEGYNWVGCDIAPSMLGRSIEFLTLQRNLPYFPVREVALEREVEGDLFLQDIGQGFGFRPGSFDGAIRFATAFSYTYSANCFSTVYPSYSGFSTLRRLIPHHHHLTVLPASLPLCTLPFAIPRAPCYSSIRPRTIKSS